MNGAETFDHQESEIAIIGLSGRFPGARNVDELWKNLCDGVESISFFSKQELLEAGVAPDLLRKPNYVRACGMLDNIEMFDAAFFGFNQREAEIIDPQQRLFLESAWEALENAGYDSETYAGRIGVYAGVGLNLYLLDNIYPNPEIVQSMGQLQTIIQNDKDFLATRVSFKLNLKGPSVVVQSACSTSLLAVHMACQSLLSGESDIALAGGVSIRFQKKRGYLYQEFGIGSPDGHCRTFDAKAQGTVGGDGVGIVALKRLPDALEDGDSILAVIKGSAANNDGSLKVGYTAPSVDGQAQVIAEAHAVAGVDPETITYVEAHGTATPLGDPIEVEALKKSFRTDRKGFCALGSIKSNIGHLDTAAGVAGLIKTALALKHKLIPPSLHFERPNPEIDLENSPFYVNTRLARWEAGPTPRRAGVSSFGIGGTNVHIVLEEAPEIKSGSIHRSHYLLALSAKTDSALEAMTANLAGYLKQHADTDIANIAYTLQVGRRRFERRRVILCQDAETAVRAIESLDANSVKTRSERLTDAPVVFMFPGQGAQHEKMGLGLYQSEPTFREQIDRCAELLEPRLGLDLRRVLYSIGGDPPPEMGAMKQTFIAQPAIFAVEYALAKLWMEWGARPCAMIGHSLGEYVAACLAGVFSLEDALFLVAARGRLMQDLPEGAMLAVALSENEVEGMLSNGLSLAAVNGPSRCVVSGTAQAVELFRQELCRQGVNCRPLSTSHAFHSEMMEPIRPQFAEILKQVRLGAPQIPYISNVTGKWITANEATSVDYWLKHLRQPVRFADGVAELLKDPARILLEVGPGQTLGALVRQQKENASGRVILSSMRHHKDNQPDDAVMLMALGQLWLAGAHVDWVGLYPGARPRRIPLPTYPFERRRYWIDAPGAGKHEDALERTAQDNSNKVVGSPGGMKRILQQQIQVMSQQLAALGKARVNGGHRVPAATRAAIAIEPPQTPARGGTEQGLVTGPAPLTPIQRWFFEQNQPNAHHWNHSALLEVNRAIDPSLIARAFKELLAHHDSLRLRFKREGSNIRQINAGMSEEAAFTYVDLFGASGAEVESAIEERATVLQTSLDLSEGPLARMAFFDLGAPNSNRLLIVIHHLAVDLFSWRILLEDLNAALQQLSRGERIQLPPKTTSFKQWAERLHEYAQSDEVRREAAYWIASGQAATSHIPVDYSGPNTVGSARSLSVSLSVEETQALLDRVSRLYRAQPITALLAALGTACAGWLGDQPLLVDLEGHGREPIYDEVNLSRTVGWFTSIHPMPIETGKGRELERVVEVLKRRINQTPNGGIGYGLLRYLTEDRQAADPIRALPRAKVCFNYWGRFDRLPSRSSLLLPAAGRVGPDQSLNGIRPYLIEVNGIIRKGRLQVDWTYSENAHRRSSIEEIAGRCLDALKSLGRISSKASRL